MKKILLGTSALIALSLFSGAANAACTNTAPTAGETVTCTGTSTTRVAAGAGQNNITVNVEDGAQLNTGAVGGISLNDGSAINLLGSAQVTTTGNFAKAIVIGANGAVILNGTSNVTTTGLNAYGITDYGAGTTVTLNDAANIVTSGDGAHGIFTTGASDHIVLNGGSITTHGANANGIDVYGAGSINTVVTVGSGSTVTTTGAGSHAVALTGPNDQVENHGTLSSTDAAAIFGGVGSDTVKNFGIVSSNSGVSPISLGAGNDTLTLGHGSQITGGDIDGGAGTDTVNLIQTGSEDNRFLGFEILNVSGAGTKWTLSSDSTFATAIHIGSGSTLVNNKILHTATATIDPEGTLSGSGLIVGNVNSMGTIAPLDGDKIGTVAILGNLVQSGGVIAIGVGQNGASEVEIVGPGNTATLSNGVELRVNSLSGFTGGIGTALHADGGIIGNFAQVKYAGNGAVDVIPDPVHHDIDFISVDGTPVAASDFAAAQSGLDYFDILGDEQLAGLSFCGPDSCARTDDQRKHLWAKGFGRFDQESASGGNQSFDATIAGSALGGDMPIAKDLRVGVSFGYANADEDVANHAASADINTVQTALYADYQKGGFFLTGAIGGGWQSFDLSRQIGAFTPIFNAAHDTIISLGPGAVEADATTHGWLFNAGLQTGVILPFPHGWRLTPSAGVAYQHQWVNGYQEHNGNAADVAIDDHQADALRLKAQLELANDIPWQDMVVTPHLKIGVRQEVNLGGHVNGTFVDNNDFTLDLKDSNRTVGLIGLGAQIAFANGLATYVDYDGAMTTDSTVHAVSGGLRYSW